ncbi:hypothetical protein V500_03935 [Pseudogymnoascus sp. VKM F-4518 (FW-2643)]|nr:hypothetical protein V500_03935 [Pseudogymnoascus sp. VKM F-4518 (FW-2643)]
MAYGVATVFLSTRQRATSVPSNVDRLRAPSDPTRSSPATRTVPITIPNPIPHAAPCRPRPRPDGQIRAQHSDQAYKATRTERPGYQPAYSSTTVHPQTPTKTGHWRTTPLKNLLHASRYGRASLGRRVRGRACICAKAGASIICRFGGFWNVREGLGLDWGGRGGAEDTRREGIGLIEREWERDGRRRACHGMMGYAQLGGMAGTSILRQSSASGKNGWAVFAVRDGRWLLDIRAGKLSCARHAYGKAAASIGCRSRGYKGALSPVIGMGMAMGGRTVLERRSSIIGEAPPPKARHDMT